MTDKELLAEAGMARMRAYAPYSHYMVGAALMTKEGKVYCGCNVENAGYAPSACAERTAFQKAVYEGEREFAKIAIVGGMEGTEWEAFCGPCGVCRQVMMEFCDPETFIILLMDDKGEPAAYTLKELFPLGFGPGNLR